MNVRSAGEGAVFSATDAATWTNGVWEGDPPATLSGVFSDSRTPVPGALFVALRGPNFDGHAYVGQVLADGAGGIMADTSASLPPGLPILRVADTRMGLRALAAGWRAHVPARIVGVTGSVGKTTVKEWTAHLLAAVGPTVRTPGNWNNDLGLPKSLLAIPEGTAFAVLEAGTNHPGEIRSLAELMRPDCAILTTVGPSHIEFFGTEAAIADEKADLLRVLPADGLAVLDADSPHFSYLSAQAPCRVATVSLVVDADYRAVDADPDAGVFTVLERGTGGTCLIRTGQPGRHQLVNALQAIAMARLLGVDWGAIAERFLSLPRMPMRWERIERGEVVWINDAYNANATSMRLALETFGAMDAGDGPKLAILGDMFELGAEDQRLHAEIGRVVAQAGVDILLAVGERASTWLADAAISAGMQPERVHRAADIQAAREEVAGLLRPGAHVLLKASRGMALERMLA